MGVLGKTWILCCERADVDGEKQPPYLHECGCPSIFAIYRDTQKSVQMCGYDEFVDVDEGIYPQVPPVRYLKKVNAGTIDETVPCSSGCDAPKYVTNASFSRTYEKDPLFADCPISDTGVANYITKIYDCDFSPCSSTYDRDWNQTDLVDGSTEVVSNTFASSSYDWGTRTTTLSDPDIESDALARTPAVDGLTNGTVWEVRTNDYYFDYRTSKYALYASNLIVDARYVARVSLARRPAIKNPDGVGYVDEDGEPSVWTSEDEDGNPMVDEYTFKATATKGVVPTTGTWPVGDPETSPYDLIPAIVIPQEQGWQYRVTGLSIELALT